ncbi:hypothetical protein M885DRAFT_150579 [Pelagophyceae sp. CCMP2097]|nr:hypothetical protein M885DRAFT_150579 [Pelagophyceae sp. CCMP2097]
MDLDLELSSDEEDEILGNLRRGRGGAATGSTMDPYGRGTASSGDRGPKTTGASSSLDFGAMRDAFQEAGLDLDEPTPNTGANPGQPGTRSTDYTDATDSYGDRGARHPEDSYTSREETDDDRGGGQTGASSVYSSRDEAAPRASAAGQRSTSTFGGAGSSGEYKQAQRGFDAGASADSAVDGGRPLQESKDPPRTDPSQAPRQSEDPLRQSEDAHRRSQALRPSEDSLRVDLLRDGAPSPAGGDVGDVLTRTADEEDVNLGTMQFEREELRDVTLQRTRSFEKERLAPLISIGRDSEQASEVDGAARGPASGLATSRTHGTATTPGTTTPGPRTADDSTVYSPPRVDESLDARHVDLTRDSADYAGAAGPDTTPAAAENDDDPARWLESARQDIRDRDLPAAGQPPRLTPRDESPPPPPPRHPKARDADVRASVAPPPPDALRDDVRASVAPPPPAARPPSRRRRIRGMRRG